MSLARAQDRPALLKHPRGELWLVVPPGWTGEADAASSRLELGSPGHGVSVTVAAFPGENANAEILEAVRNRFSRLITDPAGNAIAWESSALAVPKAPGFALEGRGSGFARNGHPLRLEVYLARGRRHVFAFAVVGGLAEIERDRDGLDDLLASARSTEAEAASVASASVAAVGSLVTVPGSDFRLRLPRSFEADVIEGHLILHTASGTATLAVTHRETSLAPAAFLDSLRGDYAESLRAQLGGADVTTLAWGETLPFAAGSRTGVRARLVVTVTPRADAPVKVEQRFYVLPARGGVLFLTGSAPESSREAAVFDAIAATLDGSGERRP